MTNWIADNGLSKYQQPFIQQLNDVFFPERPVLVTNTNDINELYKLADKLQFCQFFIWKDPSKPECLPYICVRATKIEDNNICIDCPFCVTKRRKDGTRSHKAKNVIHYHNNGHSNKIRMELRDPHCNNITYGIGNTDLNFPTPASGTNFCIFITQTTLKASNL
jgi:hypothetical protein